MTENPQIVAICAVRALNAIPDPLVRAVLDHHSTTLSDSRWSRMYCNGCDMGCSCEAAEWPCSTVDVIAEHYGIDLPEQWRVDWRAVVEAASED